MSDDAFLFPLSFAQQRLWFLDQFEPGSPLFNIPSARRIEGPLDVGVLERSVNEIVNRHEILRTVFRSVGGEPRQMVLGALHVAVPVMDVSDLAAAAREARAVALANEEASKPFDLSRGPLVRAFVVRLGEGDHVFVLNMHHIVSDAWSLGIFWRELVDLYNAFVRGEASPLADLPVQYADFAQWQREWLKDEVLAEQLRYWRGALGGRSGVLELPTDRPRPAVQGYRGDLEGMTVPPAVSEGLRDLSRREGVTLYMVLLAAFKVLLSRYAGSEDVVVGTPIANRNRAEIEGLIGFFVNTLVLRTDLSGDPSFRELLGRVREVALGAYAHQDIPFEKLVEELEPERDMSHAPLFQVMFTMQNASPLDLRIPGLKVSPLAVRNKTSKYDLLLMLMDNGDRITGWIEYNSDLFDGSTIVRFREHYLRILEAAVSNVETRVSRLELLTHEERQHLLVELNDTAVSYPREKCIHELFEEVVQCAPQRAVLAFGDDRMTYGELNTRANRLAHYLHRLAVALEEPVGICMGRSFDMVVALLGVLKAGGAYVPLDPENPRERLAYIMRESAVRIVLTDTSLAGSVPRGAARIVNMEDDWRQVALEDPQNPRVSVGPENLAYIMYTSGTTGVPKGVSIRHRGVVRLVKGANYVGLDDTEVLLQMAPISFDASTFEIWGALLNGALLVVMPAEKPSLADIERVLSRYGVTTLWLTAGLFHRIVDERVGSLSGVRQLLAGGDVLSAERVRKVLGSVDGITVVNGYGPTECTTFACCCPVTDEGAIGASVPIGRPVSNTTVYIVDRNMHPVPVGVPGELLIGGDGLGRGYLGSPGITAERFVPDPFDGSPGGRLYRTGDVARYLPDGNVEFIGRLDDQLKIRGFRIEPEEIVAVLNAHPSIRESVVVARADHDERRLVAYLEIDGEVAPKVNELRTYLKEKLPEYMLPASFVVVGSLPRTASGKVDRKRLPAPSDERPDVEEEFIGPRTSVEELIAATWREILGIEEIGVRDNFFDLGGNSLSATQLVSQIREQFQVELPLRSLFEDPTVAGLAGMVEESRGSLRPGAEKIAAILERVERISDEEAREILHKREEGTR